MLERVFQSAIASVVGLTIVLSSVSVSALELRGVKLNQDTVVFMVCEASICDALGSPNGFHLKDLSFSPNLRKLGALVLGTGEVVIAAVGTAFSTLGAAMGANIFLEGSTLLKFFVVGTVLAPSGLTIAAANVFDALNPIYHWRKANAQKAIDAEYFEKTETLTIAIEESKEMERLIESVRDVLMDITPVSHPSGLDFPMRISAPSVAIPAFN